MEYNVIKKVITILKSKDLETRLGLQRIFEDGGALWISDGYIAIKLCEVGDDLKNKSIDLNALKAWAAIHKKGDVLNKDEFIENDSTPPNMGLLIEGDFIPADNVKIDIELLKKACDVFNIKKVGFERSKNNKYLYRIKILDKYELSILNRAMDPELYIMGLK